MLRVYILSTVPLVEMEDEFFFSFSSYYEISTIIILITFHLSEKKTSEIHKPETLKLIL